ncbi:MAG TPA: Crp/Fnr family transcriptional regulator [Bryobacteraceae bacterium]|jgi:CRP-like cAMP-binding protein
MAEGHARNGKNRLLSTLGETVYEKFAPNLERVSLSLRQKLIEPNKPIEHVYFPINGVVSMLAHIEGGYLIEVATVGNERMIGLPLFLGTEMTPGTSFSQVPGEALRMSANDFREAIETSGPFTKMLHRYTQALMVQISQGNACNRIHSLEERCARWLLLCHDRVGEDEFLLTQEFLSQMLGVRRASVTLVASTFQQAGFIEYSRGRIRILDRKGLESACCECYTVIRQEYDRMLEPNNERT